MNKIKYGDYKMKKIYKISIIAITLISFMPLITMLAYHIQNFELELCWIYMFLSLISAGNLSSFLTTLSQGKKNYSVKNVIYVLFNILIVVANVSMFVFITLIL